MNRKKLFESKPEKRAVWDTCSLISEIKAAGTWQAASHVSAAGKSVVHAQEWAQISALFYYSL